MMNPNDTSDKQPARKGSDQPDHEIREIPLGEITVSEHCSRQEEDPDLENLAKSIARQGLIEFPTVVRSDGGFLLVAGSRRYAACRLLGRSTIPCHVVAATPAHGAILSVAENNLRRTRHPVEEAKVFQHLRDLGLTEMEIAEDSGLPQSVVNDRLGLLLLDEDILRHIDARPDSPFKYTHAVALSQIMRTRRPNQRTEVRLLHDKVIRNRLSTLELGALVHLVKNGGYDGLPEPLQMLLLTNKNMTAAMASLFLAPESVIWGDDGAQKLRQKAEYLKKADVLSLVTRAVDRGWTYEDTKRRLRRMLLESAAVPANEPSPAQAFLGRLHIMAEDLQAVQHDLPDPADVGPDWFERMQTALTLVVRQAELLTKALEERRQQGIGATSNGKGVGVG